MGNPSLEEELQQVEAELDKVDFMFKEPTSSEESPSLLFFIQYTKKSYTVGNEEKHCAYVNINKHAPDKNGETGSFFLDFPYPFTMDGLKDAREDAIRQVKSLYCLPPVLVPKTGVFPKLGGIKYNHFYRVGKSVAERVKKAAGI